MKYSIDESVEQIEKRRTERMQKKAVRRLSTASMLLLFTLSAALYQLTDFGMSEKTESLYGSFLLSPEAGGYILVAVLAFLLGIVVCMLIYRKREQGNGKRE